MHDDFGGLKRDLSLIARRRALGLFGAGAGELLLRPGQLLAAGTCVADAPETAGPYPADGTNHAGGETSDVLTQSGVVRRDIRYSFLSTTTKAKGVPVKLKLKLVNSKDACAPLAGYAVYAWQCDRDAKYSLYTLPGESYLRGVQVTDEKGHLTFTTIFPACYPGRYPHIHLEIFSSLAAATTGRNAILTTQLALPADACNEVYDNARGYQSSIANFKNISLQQDSVFGDDTPAQLAAMTPKMKGSVADGYSAVATVGVAV
ncbi:MAG: intradiol ring-cleavage dioxygenase [Alphaproteobacteria bacterium]|nr:intradiol ring-cleavage dioxygenase [Alphaproteobacteria bacterium]